MGVMGRTAMLHVLTYTYRR